VLLLERRHLHWQFGGHGYFRHAEPLPADNLCPVAKVGVFDESVTLPAASGFDARSPPNAGRAIENGRQARPVACDVLDGKVRIQHQRHRARDRIIVLVQVRPACLHPAHIGPSYERRYRPLQKIGCRDKIRVEDGNKGAAGTL